LGAACYTLAAACANNPAPSGWLPTPDDAPQDPYGAWIVVQHARGETDGELIAVHEDSVFVLTQSGRLAGFAHGGINQARIAYFDAQWVGLAVWTFVGSLATISNGYFAGFTLPLWLIAGPIATASQSRAPLESVKRESQWAEMRMYARFPQGMPQELDRSVLKPR
jgi:hypothetical protein